MPVGQLQPVRGDQSRFEARTRRGVVGDPRRADSGVPRQARRPRLDDEPLAQARRGRLGPREERQPVEELADLVVEPRAGYDRVCRRSGPNPPAQHAVQRRRAVSLGRGGPPGGTRGERRQREADDRPGSGAAVGRGCRQRRRRLELLHHLRRGRDVEPERTHEAQEEALVPLVVAVPVERVLRAAPRARRASARRRGARSPRPSGRGSAASRAASAGTPPPGSCARAGRRSPPRSARSC